VPSLPLAHPLASDGAALTGGEQVADLLKQHNVVRVRSLGLLLSETRPNSFVWGDV
jgi:hypothetical protein